MSDRRPERHAAADAAGALPASTSASSATTASATTALAPISSAAATSLAALSSSSTSATTTAPLSSSVVFNGFYFGQRLIVGYDHRRIGIALIAIAAVVSVTLRRHIGTGDQCQRNIE
jgi:hypothetical protein